MSHRRMWAALPAVALMSVALAACAASSGSTGSAAGGASAAPGSAMPGNPAPVGTAPTIIATGTPAPGEPDCANWPSTAAPGPLPASFVPVEALRCVLGTTTVAGKGAYVSGTLERATEDLGILVDALRRPSGRMVPGTICPALAMIEPQIVLVASDGAMIRPRFPVDDCGLVQQGVLAAIAELPWHVVSVRLISSPPDVTDSPAGSLPALLTLRRDGGRRT